LTWVIIAEHVFRDGNKRTGIAALLTFLAANGYDVDASIEEFVEISVRLADSKTNYTREQLAQWIRDKLRLSTIHR